MKKYITSFLLLTAFVFLVAFIPRVNSHKKRITTKGHSSKIGSTGINLSENTNEISNGLVKISINQERGTFNIIDLKRGSTLISDSYIGFSLAPYVELADLSAEEFEVNQKATYYSSINCKNTVNKVSSMNGNFSIGESITLSSKKDGQGQLQVQFTLYPGESFVDIHFSFKNLNEKPVRLRQVNIIDCNSFMTDCDKAFLQLLNGDSGARKTTVVKGRSMVAENNILCFFADTTQTRSLVAGGLTYTDFRKYVSINNDDFVMYAHDPVGKRVDPGQNYESEDRFYLNGTIDNPFEALEAYAKATEKARGIKLHYYTFPSTCMWFLSVIHFGGDTGSTNNTVGAVRETEHIANSGFMKYSPVAVRLVPDCYEENNEQGWWDDEHWQMHGRKEVCVAERHYEKPYETTEKWASAVRELGGIPLTYFQPGIRSEDYTKAFPGHMLYNQPNKNETYDYTDPDFLNHWDEVHKNLKTGGVQGIFFDYPDRAFASHGGFEDRYATATYAYRNVFRIARKQLGGNAFLQERMGPGSDATLDLVSSVRTVGDNNRIITREINKVAMRWYKNRRLINYDMDGKGLLQSGRGENIHKIETTERRAILTLSYAITGRLLLTESFRLFPNEVLYDLSRIYPFHSTTLSARPLDAFICDQPSIFIFPISENWQQLVLYNHNKEDRNFKVPVSGETAFGAMGLNANSKYYVYDFWNDRFVGKISGKDTIKQEVITGEARMFSIHAVQENPQWISTNRHIMQGYVDLVKKPVWNNKENTLSGTSSVVGGEPYRVTVALNGYMPVKVKANGAVSNFKIRTDDKNLVDIVLTTKENKDVTWEIECDVL